MATVCVAQFGQTTAEGYAQTLGGYQLHKNPVDIRIYPATFKELRITYKPRDSLWANP